jgi:hypothetical protein
MANREIRVLALKVFGVVTGSDAQLYVRVQPRKPRQPRHQPHGCQWDWNRYCESTRWLDDALSGTIDQAQGFVDSAVHVVSSRGEFQATACPLEQ